MFQLLAARTTSAPTESLERIDLRRNNVGKIVRVMTGVNTGKEGVIAAVVKGGTLTIKWNNGEVTKQKRFRLVIVNK